MTAAGGLLALITIVSGRHDHLQRQLDTVTHSPNRPWLHVVVAMDDANVRSIVGSGESVEVVEIDSGADGLELASARNIGARFAIAAGADSLVFLDVDCLPGPELFSRYRRALHDHYDDSVICCGPVTYLEQGQINDDLAAYTNPHPARPDPPDGEVHLDSDLTLFWSLSFALNAHDWRNIRGFHTGYRGYGAEDTDFAMSAAAQGYRLAWVGGAHAYHQYHRVSDPPVEHLDDILRNGALFRRRWGWWPMDGWLTAFEDRGLVEYDAATDNWTKPNHRTATASNSSANPPMNAARAPGRLQRTESDRPER